MSSSEERLNGLEEEQKRAVNERDKNILVSAGAGSGKTRVLVQRVIEMLLESEDITIDQICVVTFTNAAAKDMKDKIKKALVDEIAKLNEKDNLNEEELAQLDRLSKANMHIDFASISTLHSFCKKLIEENYKELDLNPNFSEILGSERDSMMEDCLDKVFEEEYKNPDFKDFVLRYDDKFKDDAIKDIIKKYYEFLTTIPNKKEWFEKKCKVQNTDFYLKGIKDIKEFASSSAEIPYVKESAKKSKNDTNIDKLPKLKYSKKTLEQIDKLYEKDCDILNRLVKKFDDEFTREKRRKNVLDFSDLERYALYLLYEKDGEYTSKKISKLGMDISDSYKQIFVDEYQDINDVQEEILRAISGDFKKNNLFLVGDIKQSIYLFRHAKPDIFKAKYKNYRENSNIGLPIDMNKNFRSSHEVLDAINPLFEKIMDGDFSEIKYDSSHSLSFGKKDSDKEIDRKTEFLNLYFDVDKLKDYEAKDSTKKKKAKNFTINRPYFWGGDRRYTANRTNMYAEGIMIGKRILELLEETRDKNDNERVHLSDIAILVNRNDDGPIYKAALDELKIGSQVGTDADDFFKSDEVRLMKEILNVIANPRCDIPLAAVLKSEIIGLSDEELASIVSVSGKVLSDKSIGKSAIKKSKEDEEKNKLTKSHDFEKYLASEKNIFLYDKIVYFAQSQSDDPNYGSIVEKINNFFDTFDILRKKSKYQSIPELVKSIYDITNLPIIVSSWGDSYKAVQNLNTLISFTESITSSYGNLYDFLKLFNSMYVNRNTRARKKKSDDDIVANFDVLNPDCVKIITIHSSKGLQFPIVFLTRMNGIFVERQFSSYKENRFSFSTEEGIYFDPIDSNRNKYTTLKKFYVNLAEKRKYRAEKLRLFYVALTRARDKLILTSSKGIPYSVPASGKDNDDKSTASATPFFMDANSKSKKFDNLGTCTSFLDYLSYVVSLDEKNGNKDYKNTLRSKYNIYDRYYDVEQLFDDVKKIKKNGLDASLSMNATNTGVPENIIDEARANLEKTYPFITSTNVTPKISVSEIAKKHYINYEHDNLDLNDDTSATEDMTYGTDQNNKESTSSISVDAISKGNGYHRFMQMFDYSKIDLSAMDDAQIVYEIEKQKSSMLEQKLGKNEELGLVETSKVLEFLRSTLGELFIKAYAEKNLYREQPFMKVLTREEIKSYSAGDDLGLVQGANESQIIQGVIDAFTVEDDKFIVVDYKTDGVLKYGAEKGRAQLIDRYKNQLKLYSRAISEILGKTCDGMFIYSFDLSEVIEIK